MIADTFLWRIAGISITLTNEPRGSFDAYVVVDNEAGQRPVVLAGEHADVLQEREQAERRACRWRGAFFLLLALLAFSLLASFHARADQPGEGQRIGALR